MKIIDDCGLGDGLSTDVPVMSSFNDNVDAFDVGCWIIVTEEYAHARFGKEAKIKKFFFFVYVIYSNALDIFGVRCDVTCDEWMVLYKRILILCFFHLLLVNY